MSLFKLLCGGFWLGVLLSSTLAVKPILVRRLAVEDRPLLFKVALPQGAVVKEGDLSVTVGSPGLTYAFDFKLLDSKGRLVAQWETERSRPEATWAKKTVVEPYTADYENKLVLQVKVEVRHYDEVLSEGVLRQRIPRVQDVTGPLQKSLGDEENYPDFVFTVLGNGANGDLTTQDRRFDEETKSEYAQVPFPLLCDDGEVIENERGPINRRGCLVLQWRNLYDNLNEPFWGKREKALSSFGLVLRPRWDLSGSHYLVQSEEEPHFKTRVLNDGTYVVDLDHQLADLSQEQQPFGRGEVVLPLPYDRVGVVEVGFYARDTAFPKNNVTITKMKRFVVRDDIAPHIVLSFRRWKARTGEPYHTVDGVNKLWFETDKPWALPESLVEQSKAEKLQPREIFAGEPERLYIFVFDNTRLERLSAKAALKGPSGARAGSYGFRATDGTAMRMAELERTAFDPSTARTKVDKPWVMLFEKPGRYNLQVEAVDIHGNERRLRVPLHVKERRFDVLNIKERQRRY